MPTRAKSVPKPSTIMRKLDEVEEYAGHVREIRRKLCRLTPGSDAYQELLADLADLWVNLDWLKLKAESAALMVDEYEESLPDDV